MSFNILLASVPTVLYPYQQLHIKNCYDKEIALKVLFCKFKRIILVFVSYFWTLKQFYVFHLIRHICSLREKNDNKNMICNTFIALVDTSQSNWPRRTEDSLKRHLSLNLILSLLKHWTPKKWEFLRNNVLGEN